MKAEFENLFKLERAERLQLVEDLWESIAAEDQNAPLPQWKLDELHRRRDALRNNPSTGIPWNAVKDSLRQKD